MEANEVQTSGRGWSRSSDPIFVGQTFSIGNSVAEGLVIKSICL